MESFNWSSLDESARKKDRVMEGGKPFHSPPSQLHHAAKIIKQPIYQACIMYLAKTMRLSDLGLGQFSKKHESNPNSS